MSKNPLDHVLGRFNKTAPQPEKAAKRKPAKKKAAKRKARK
jgi:hypothetical protein